LASAWVTANHPNFAVARRGERFAKPNINQGSHPVSTGFFGTAKVTMRTKDMVSTRFGKRGRQIQMMDLREATNTLNAYSTLIMSKTRFCDKALNPETSEEKNVIEKLIAALKVETKASMIISMLVLEVITSHHEQFVFGFTGELAELTEALNRNRAATDEARKTTLAHEQKFQVKEPGENPVAKAIREFKARQGMR
jgi:hypothetical protein